MWWLALALVVFMLGLWASVRQARVAEPPSRSLAPSGRGPVDPRNTPWGPPSAI